ncbi:MAG: peroxiredoxin family protein [Planctomycetota bacterium]
MAPSAAAWEGADDSEEVVFVESPRQAAWLFDDVDRVDLDVSLAPEAEAAQAFFDQGLSLVHVGWLLEAERSFMTVLTADPDCPMAFWGIALASAEVPVRAAWFARAAWLKRGLASPLERRLIDALARYYSVIGPDEPDDLPEVRSPEPGEESDGGMTQELADRRRPSAAAAERLAGEYKAILAELPEARALLLRLLCAEELSVPSWKRAEGTAAGELDELCVDLLGPLVKKRPDHPAQSIRLRIFEGKRAPADVLDLATDLVVSFPDVPELWRLGAGTLGVAGRGEEALEMLAMAQRVAQEHATRIWVQPTEIYGGPDFEDPLWSIPAPGWSLPDAYGNTMTLAGLRDRPVLLVNFLGFGCVHCVEQLQALAPEAERFTRQGIEIVAVGTQKPDELRPSLGPDPATTGYPFPVLCDPDLEQFRAYRAFDDFAEVALHGTYLIDGRGRILWSDISHLPYMDIALLAENCRTALKGAGEGAAQVQGSGNGGR